jgi:5-methylcytosine-specific restriction endonuclease McrA
MDSKIDFLAPRRCMREPINEIFDAARLLSSAANAHLAGDRVTADNLLRAANMRTLRVWIGSLIGSKAANPDQWRYHRSREIPDAPPILPNVRRVKKREPSQEERRLIIQRYGRNCVFCGIPVISDQVRKAFHLAYPDAAPWGRTNASRHAAFQCMWMQFDHVLPHSRGGDNSIDNVVVTCAPCNFGRMQFTLEEVGLNDPRRQPPRKSNWDGLERMLTVLPSHL